MTLTKELRDISANMQQDLSEQLQQLQRGLIQPPKRRIVPLGEPDEEGLAPYWQLGPESEALNSGKHFRENSGSPRNQEQPRNSSESIQSMVYDAVLSAMQVKEPTMEFPLGTSTKSSPRHAFAACGPPSNTDAFGTPAARDLLALGE